MKRKGFTLIELLAVIVILAIIALIATPAVMNIIEDSRKSAVENSARNIARAAEIYYANNIIKNLENQSIDLEKDTLPYNGSKPEKGVVTYDSSGRAYIKMYMNGYCVSISHNNELKTDKIEKDSCALDVIILSIDPNGGEVSEHSREYDNVDVIGELPTPTRVGYTFLGWTLKDGTEVDSTTEIKENMTIYAKWEANTYEVTLNLNNGVVSDINTWDETYKKEITYDTAYGSLPVLTKEGYTFIGWYTSVGLKVIDTTLLKIADNHTLEAKYEANKYEVTFVYNDNVTEDTTREVVFNSNYGTLPNVERTGYTFKGWYDENNNLIETTTVVSMTKNHTLNALWEANKYNVTFKYNNGNEDTVKEVTYDSAYGEIPSPTKEGYNFLGWHTTGGVLVESTTIVQIAEDHTVNASWGVNSYLVTFDANGGTVTPGNTEIVYGETYGSKLGELPTPTRTGYTFNGWYTDKTSGTVVTKETTMNTASNHYIYARWTANTYTVTFNRTNFKNGEVVYFNPVTAQVCDASEAVSSTGTKDGCMKWYAFLDNGGNTIKILLDHNTTAEVAWNTDVNGTTPVTALAQLNNDITNWNDTIKSTARLITAKEINQIVPTSLNHIWVQNNTNTWYYLHNGNQIIYEGKVGSNIYAWLFNNTGYDEPYSCLPLGCSQSENDNNGYWTSTYAISGQAWGIDRIGSLYHYSLDYVNYGVRPVIEIDKSLLKETKIVTYDNLYGELPNIESQNHKLLGWYKSDGTIITKDTKVDILSNINVYSKLGLKEGFAVYFNPTIAKRCTPSEAVSTTGTKDGCMKWYAFLDDGGSTIKLLLDHNTTKVVAWSNGETTPTIVTSQLALDVTNWNNSVKATARLISASEVNEIAPTSSNYSWNVNDYNTWYYLHNGTLNIYEGAAGTNKYAWLFDNTYDCTQYGCNANDNESHAYWTSTYANSNLAWHVYRHGNIGFDNISDNPYSGVRPVIEVSRTIFE